MKSTSAFTTSLCYPNTFYLFIFSPNYSTIHCSSGFLDVLLLPLIFSRPLQLFCTFLTMHPKLKVILWGFSRWWTLLYCCFLIYIPITSQSLSPILSSASLLSIIFSYWLTITTDWNTPFAVEKSLFSASEKQENFTPLLCETCWTHVSCWTLFPTTLRIAKVSHLSCLYNKYNNTNSIIVLKVLKTLFSLLFYIIISLERSKFTKIV